MFPKARGSSISARCASISRRNSSSSARRRSEIAETPDPLTDDRHVEVQASLRIKPIALAVRRYSAISVSSCRRPLAVMRYSRTCRPDSDSRHVRFHPAFDQQFLKGGVERSLFDAELVGRQLMDALRDRVAVQRLRRQDAQHQHHERAGRKASFSRHSLPMPTVRRRWVGCQATLGSPKLDNPRTSCRGIPDYQPSPRSRSLVTDGRVGRPPQYAVHCTTSLGWWRHIWALHRSSSCSSGS